MLRDLAENRVRRMENRQIKPRDALGRAAEDSGPRSLRGSNPWSLRAEAIFYSVKLRFGQIALHRDMTS